LEGLPVGTADKLYLGAVIGNFEGLLDGEELGSFLSSSSVGFGDNGFLMGI